MSEGSFPTSLSFPMFSNRKGRVSVRAPLGNAALGCSGLVPGSWETEWHPAPPSKETMPRVTPHCAIKKTELSNQRWGPGAGGDWRAHIWQKDGPCQGHCASQSLGVWKACREQSPELQTTSEKKSHHSPRAFPLGVGKRWKERVTEDSSSFEICKAYQSRVGQEVGRRHWRASRSPSLHAWGGGWQP